MKTPPEIPADMIDRLIPNRGMVWVEVGDHEELRRATGTTLLLPSKSERGNRSETMGRVHAVAEDVHGLEKGDLVHFRLFVDHTQKVERVTSEGRKFSLLPFGNIYAKIEEETHAA